MLHKYFIFIIACVSALAGCDLQPKITSLPDSVGEFISNRYPTLLADAKTQPEIYNSAVTDYGVYSSSDLYGKLENDISYAKVSDYQLVSDRLNDKDIIVKKGDTVYSLARNNKMSVSEFAKINNLQEPYLLAIGQRLKTSAIESNIRSVNTDINNHKTKEITIIAGDTLYSISRKYSIPVNDLAVMNKLSAPFTLSVGQTIIVPDTTMKMQNGKEQQISPAKQQEIANTTTKTEYANNYKNQTSKIKVRSSSKFSWPVKGKIVSEYGAKTKGLFNDGINIVAPMGTSVKAAENGVVAYAGNEVKGMGNLIIIQHADGWMTVYAHLNSMQVRRGIGVSVGQEIGKVGMTGKVDKSQLHFEIRKGTKAYNPTLYLKK